VQHGAGQVEDRSQIGPCGARRPLANGRQQGLFARQRQAVLDAFPGRRQFGAGTAGDQLPAMGFDQLAELLQQSVDRGEMGFFVHVLSPVPGRNHKVYMAD